MLVANSFTAHCEDCSAMERLVSADREQAMEKLRTKGWQEVKQQIGLTRHIRIDVLLCPACKPTKQPRKDPTT